MSLLKSIKQRGLKYSFAIGFNRLVPQWLFRCRRFVIYELDPNLVASANARNDTDVRWCESESELAALEAFTYFQRSLSTGESRAVQATINGKLVAGFWSATDRFDESELGIRVLLEPQQAWLFAAFVEKRFRGRGIYTQILEFIVPELIESNIKEMLVAVNPDNVGSNKVHQKYAAATSGTVLGIRFFKFAFCTTNGSITRNRTMTWNWTKHPIEIRISK